MDMLNSPMSIDHRDCTKDFPMPLELGDKAREMGVVWHHDNIVCLDEDDVCERFVPYKCLSCGYEWFADLGD